MIDRLLEPGWYGWIIEWTVRVLAGSLLLLVTLFVVFLLMRVLRNVKVLAWGVWPEFSKISIVSSLLGITIEQDAKRDAQLAALNKRLVEVEGKFAGLDSKVSAMGRELPGENDG